MPRLKPAIDAKSSQHPMNKNLPEAPHKTFHDREDFAIRAKALRQRLHSTEDSSQIIRADRDRDTTA